MTCFLGVAALALLGARVLAVSFETNALVSRQTGTFIPKPGNFPEKGDDNIAGGIFCISLTDLATYLEQTGNNPGATGTESPTSSGAITTGQSLVPFKSPVESFVIMRALVVLKQSILYAPNYRRSLDATTIE
jgi:hypothetical protein